MVAAAGAGASPIPHKQLNTENLAKAIEFCLTPEANAAAQRMADQMRVENGVKTAVASFHNNLPLDQMRCNVLPHRAASWVFKKKNHKVVRLCKEALEFLVAEKRIKWKDILR